MKANRNTTLNQNQNLHNQVKVHISRMSKLHLKKSMKNKPKLLMIHKVKEIVILATIVSQICFYQMGLLCRGRKKHYKKGEICNWIITWLRLRKKSICPSNMEILTSLKTWWSKLIWTFLSKWRGISSSFQYTWLRQEERLSVWKYFFKVNKLILMSKTRTPEQMLSG